MQTGRHVRRAAERLFRLCTDGPFDEVRARRIAAALAASGRRQAPAVLAGFHRLVRLERDRHTALVESAAPLDADLRQAIGDALRRAQGERLRVVFREQAGLIAGVRVTAGSRVYDASVRARLAALEQQLAHPRRDDHE
jgi:F-type H+-transporting ATPase subunit delta